MHSPASFLSDPPPSPDLAAVHAADVASDGYVANHTRTWCWRPDLMRSFQSLREDLVTGSSLSPREVAVMVVATAATRGDSYCALAWGDTLAKLIDEKTAADLLSGRPAGLSEREVALAAWSRQVVADPNATTEADVQQLRDAGLGDREIFEATTWIALRLAFSTVNDAVGARPDRQLADRVRPLVREAVTFGRQV